MKIAEPIFLRCSGVTLKNRIAKAAMAEGIADIKTSDPNKMHVTLYKKWAEGGVGLQITGHIMIDRIQKAASNDPVLDSKSSKHWYKEYASAATCNGTACIVQLNHPGRQAPRAVTKHPIAPSSVASSLPTSCFAVPRAMTEADIETVITQFADSALLAKEAGFSGVEIHSAHGYLISQFLSPLYNVRTDQWGGSIENRSRILFRIVKKVRQLCGMDGFILGIKINAADFLRGGLSEEDSTEIIHKLDQDPLLDFIEVSGGNYENPVVVKGVDMKESTFKREGYFQEFAAKLKKGLKNVPLMVTGGFRTLDGINKCLEEGLDLVGVGRPFCVDPDFPNRFMSLVDDRTLDHTPPSDAISVPWHEYQMRELGRGNKPNLEVAPETVVKELNSYVAAFSPQKDTSMLWIYLIGLFVLLITGAVTYYLLFLQPSAQVTETNIA
jgi:2,4-dienoyl-CoA reductase-like NADH-dependent reductase (Old Yellow Enzyme family)